MTKEDLMQIKQLLDAMEQRTDKKLADLKQEIIRESTANMNVLIESQIQPQINLLIERMDSIESKMATQKDLDELEIAMDDRFDILEALVTRHGHEITRLKKAQ